MNLGELHTLSKIIFTTVLINESYESRCAGKNDHKFLNRECKIVNNLQEQISKF